MNDDEFSGIVRSGTSHSVSVSEHTGNAKTPKNIVTSHAEETLAKKLAFEAHDDADLFLEKIAQEIDATHQAQQSAPPDELHATNIQDIAAEGLDKNVQNIPIDALKDNHQKLDGQDNTARNRQTIETDSNHGANLQGVPIDTIASNMQALATDALSDNQQKLEKQGHGAVNVQAVPVDIVAANNVQNIPGDAVKDNRQALDAPHAVEPNRQSLGDEAVASNAQTIADGADHANRATLDLGSTANNAAQLPHDANADNTQELHTPTITPNQQQVDAAGVADTNRQPLAPPANLPANHQTIDTPTPELNRQAAPEDLPPPSNRQAVDNEHIKDHIEALPSTAVERAKPNLATGPDSSSAQKIQTKGPNRGVKAKSVTATSPSPRAPTRTAAQLTEHEKFIEAFHGRLAGIKHEVEQINDRLDVFEHKK